MIQDIAIEQLDIHPQNVRKAYTDIDELAESIKARGVMQNLTVVPNPDKKDHYLVVIGNRRLTAARKAGLKTMPCSVVEMTEKEQISTMLLENMQRSDLSVSEQAQGFQLMLDLGETETTIAEKTGFSRSTVRHRLNLAKLDQETLTRREENKDFQLTLQVSGKPADNILFDNAFEFALYEKEEGWMLDNYPEWKNPDVIAWQPLPEPYRRFKKELS